MLTVLPMCTAIAGPPNAISWSPRSSVETPERSRAEQRSHAERGNEEGTGSAADSTPEKAADLQRRVSRLLEQLNAESRRERVSAARELIQLGPKILPLLPAPNKLPNASVREAVAEIRRKLEHVQALESVRPSRVTLKATLPLKTIFDQVSRQTGNPLDLTGVPAERLQKPLAVNYRNEPFWVVVDDLAEKSGKLGSPLSALRSGLFHELAVAHAGAFRVAVRSAALRPIVGDDAHRLLRLQFSLFAEPRLRPLFLQFSGSDVSAATPDKRDLQPFDPEAGYDLPVGKRGAGLSFRVDFKVPAAETLSTVNVRGKVTLQTAAAEEKFVFANLSKPQQASRRHGGVNVTLQNVSWLPRPSVGTPKRSHTEQRSHAERGNEESGGKADDTALVRLAVSYDSGGPAFESHRTWVFHNRVRLETKDGRQIEPSVPFTTLLQADGSIAVEYRFEHLTEGPDQYRFVYFAPTLIIKVPVEFEFEQLRVAPLEQRQD